MHPINEKWKEIVKNYLKNTYHENRDTLSSSDFKYHLILHFEDGSFAHFKYAFSITSEDLDEIAVFTEHCGYHYFPLNSCAIEVYENISIEEENV